MEMFYNVLNAHTRMVVDASANGTLLDKSCNEADEILERITNNDLSISYHKARNWQKSYRS